MVKIVQIKNIQFIKAKWLKLFKPNIYNYIQDTISPTTINTIILLKSQWPL